MKNPQEDLLKFTCEVLRLSGSLVLPCEYIYLVTLGGMSGEPSGKARDEI